MIMNYHSFALTVLNDVSDTIKHIRQDKYNVVPLTRNIVSWIKEISLRTEETPIKNADGELISDTREFLDIVVDNGTVLSVDLQYAYEEKDMFEALAKVRKNIALEVTGYYKNFQYIYATA